MSSSSAGDCRAPRLAPRSRLALSRSLLTSWLAGRWLLIIPHAFSELARIGASVAIMAIVLYAIGPLPGIPGLVALVIAGGAAYGLAALAFNVLEIWTALAAYAGWMPGKAARAS